MKRLLTVLLLLATTTLQAQTPALEIQEFRGVRFVAGGVGDEEREYLESLAGEFRLRITFALAQGGFISDARVRVRDAAGLTVLETVVDGPILLLNPPSGAYTVWAEAYGQAQEQGVTAPESGQAKLNFLWRVASPAP